MAAPHVSGLVALLREKNPNATVAEIKEAILAIQLERRYTKDEILEIYLNEIYLGQQGTRAIHGFGLASEFYFGKYLAQLELHETALLVALVINPVLCSRFMNVPKPQVGRPRLGDRLMGFGLKTYEPTLRWALGHVLENSINYTQEGGTITARIGEISQGRVQIHIEDTGVGIRSMDLPHVFNRFYRGEARTADDKAIDPRGLGQGLFIARAVAEAHKGYLGIDSKVGVGTVVTMALPLPGSTVTGDTAPLIEPPVDPGATTPTASLALPPKRDS